MPGGGNPVGDDLLEFLGRVADVRDGHDLQQALFARCGHGRHVALENPLERLLLLPLGVLRSQRLDPVERERDLEVDWLLRP